MGNLPGSSGRGNIPLHFEVRIITLQQQQQQQQQPCSAWTEVPSASQGTMLTVLSHPCQRPDGGPEGAVGLLSVCARARSARPICFPSLAIT